jgi:hypothetical protein
VWCINVYGSNVVSSELLMVLMWCVVCEDCELCGVVISVSV